jgi:acyl-CoA synthetase (AMP-forming)/AMP-acid ligase II
VLSEFADLGDIHDARLGMRWDRAQLASEVSSRATALAAAGISPGSTLIIAHAASAGFFADLFAAWSLGCTAACIDPGLTSSEIATLVAFIEPSAILVAEPTGHAGTACRHSISPAARLRQLPFAPRSSIRPALRSFFSPRARPGSQKAWF